MLHSYQGNGFNGSVNSLTDSMLIRKCYVSNLAPEIILAIRLVENRVASEYQMPRETGLFRNGSAWLSVSAFRGTPDRIRICGLARQ